MLTFQPGEATWTKRPSTLPHGSRRYVIFYRETRSSHPPALLAAQDANIPGEPTNCGSKYVTGIPCGARDSKQPWRAPGTTPVFSPCGGFCMNQNSDSPSGCDVGRKPSDDWTVIDGNDLAKTDRTVWTAGSTAKVAFAALYNHGGGYAYRLCPAGDPQTEACFQKVGV